MHASQNYPAFRWFVLFSLIVATISGSILMITPAPLMGEVAHQLGVDPGLATGIVMGLWNIVGASSCLLAGFLVDRFGPNRLMILGCVLLIVPTLLFPLSGGSMKTIILLRIIQAAGLGPLTSTLGTLAADWFPVRQRGMVAGLQGVATSGGVLIGFLAAPATFIRTHSWLTTMGWMAIAPVIALACWILVSLGPKPPAHRDELSSEAQAEAQGAFAKALRSSTTWILIASVFISCWFFTGVNDLTPGYIAIKPPTGLGYGPVMAGKLMGLYQMFFMLGGLLVGFIFEKVFRESARATIGLGFLVSGILACSLLFSAVCARVSTLSLVLPAIAFFAAWVMPTIVASISINYHHSVVGRITGMAFGIGFYAGIPGILVGSAILSRTGSYHGSITLVTLVAILGAILVQFLPSPKRVTGTVKSTDEATV